MPKKTVPIARTSLTKEEINSVIDPLESGWIVQGPKVKEFQEKWSNFTDTKHSIAVTSCTSAMHISLAAAGFKSGDEAIVPAFTWISTANVVEHLGGKVVFCDIDLDTFNLNVDHIESKITKKTRAILPVHLFGLSADMDPILELANKYNLIVIEDAACGFGSYYKGIHVGNFGDTGCFSFHPRKAITTGEGGMITTSSDSLSKKLNRLRDHGAEASDLQRHLGDKPYLLADHPDAGFNQRMTDIQAALGSSQMDRANQISKERKRLAKIYDEELSAISWLKLPNVPENYDHGYQSYPCIFSPEKISEKNIVKINQGRNSFMNQLLAKGISTRPATHAVHMLKYYSNKYNISPDDYPNSWFANECSISLPLFHGLKADEQEYVIKVLLDK